MTKLWKRAGALTLAVAMSLSLILGNVPALAAGPAATLYTKPELVMDFLGDNKTTYSDGTKGDGTLHAPKAESQASVDNGADKKWNGYVPQEQSTDVPTHETIFWIGIGIKDMDQFVLSNKGNGLYSAELGLYYNPDYVEPYIPGMNEIKKEDIDKEVYKEIDDEVGEKTETETQEEYEARKNKAYAERYQEKYDRKYEEKRQQKYQDCIQANNLGANAYNQWPADNYEVLYALTDQEPLNDPNDTGALGDPTTPSQGYGTEEFYPADAADENYDASGWKMTYVSIERKAGATDTRFTGTDYDKDKTYYIAMVPFVLKDYDALDKLCICLARNASVFSIGSGALKGASGGVGSVKYGNWDKYTYHDPDHDLKLMFDYTGDLHIFSNTRTRDSYWAQLDIENRTGAVENYARMFINNEPFNPSPYNTPSQLAIVNYDTDVTNQPTALERRILHLSGGEELRVQAHKAPGQTVKVEVTRNNVLLTATQITADATTGDWTDEWTFVMPSTGNVIVTVIYDDGGGNIFDATLEVDDGGMTEPANTAQLSAQGGSPTTNALTDGSETIQVKEGTKMTVAVKRNSDYDAVVTYTEISSGATKTLTPSVSSATALTYTFDMPKSAVKVKVEFRLAQNYKAVLRLEHAGGEVGNAAKMSYTDGKGVLQSSDEITGVSNPNSTSITTRDGRIITVTTKSDPRYQVKRVRVYKNGVESQTVSVSHTAGSNLYTFTMPKYDVEVVVEYEEITAYKVRVVLQGYKSGEGAKLTGVDARVTSANPHAVTVTAGMPYDDPSLPTAAPFQNWQPEADTVVVGGGTAPNAIEVFSNAKMGVEVIFPTGTQKRTAKIDVYYPKYPPAHQDIINTTGSAASGFSFNMVPLDDAENDVVYVVVTFSDSTADELTARIRQIRPTGLTSATDAVWSALGHNHDIKAYAGDQLSVDIHVEPGWYIASAQVFDDNGSYKGATDTGAPLGVPVNLSGIGYNNGQGGNETATFTMPGVNATLLIEYKKGPPDPEPTFTAAIRKDTSLPVAQRGDGTISITNGTKGATDTYGTADSKWVEASSGDQITATYAPDTSSYVAGVTVTADVPGTSVSWRYIPGGGVEVTMPSANVVVTVTFAKRDATKEHTLTVEKDPADPDGNTVSTKGVTVTDAAKTVNPVYEGEQVHLDIHVTAGYYIDSVTLDSVSIPFSGSGYNGGAGGNETAVFTMPAGDATVVVNFKDSSIEPYKPKLTLEVTEPTGGNNSITALGNTVNAANSPFLVPTTPGAGDTVEVKVDAKPGYSVDIPVLTTPTGAVSIHWTSTDTFTFVMPNDSLKVTVPFKKGDPTQFYANLIFRGDPTGVTLARGTFGDYPLLEAGMQNNSLLVYSRAAQAGETIPYAVHIPDGYYITDVTVTPAKFGVTPTITGMIGYQQGDFLMPAGNVYLNITIAKGWPDQADYRTTLHVTAPNGGGKYSTATLTNTGTNTTTGPVPDTSALTDQSKSLWVLDGTKMRVDFAPDPNHILDSVTLTNGDNEPVSYRWTAGPGGNLALEFNIPGSSVDVDVVYKERDPAEPSQYNVVLHTSGLNNQMVTMTNTNGGSVVTMSTDGDSLPLSAAPGDPITLAVTQGTGADALIVTAYAKTKSGVLIDLTPALLGLYISEAQALAATPGFPMPFGEDVDVYITLRSDDKPGPNEHMLTLQVTGPAGSGEVKVREYVPTNLTTPVGGMEATAVGSNAMAVTTGNTITAQVVPAAGHALYSLIAYTASGKRIVVSLDSTHPTWDTYIFTMPADTTHIEAEFRKVEPKAYQIQVVVNNTVNGGKGANDAWLYEQGASGNGFKLKSGVSAGDNFDLGLIIEQGYQVDSILAVPQSSGVAVNIPLPAVTSGKAQIKMPASDLVIYVTFKLDTTTRYNILAEILYEDGVTKPTNDGEQNVVDIYGTAYGRHGKAVSSKDEDTIGQTQEAKDQVVTAIWSCAPGYVVSRYTVTTTAGVPVLSQPLYDVAGQMIGLEFVMPGAHVKVDVTYTKPDVEPPKSFTATLHYLDYDSASGTMNSCSGAAPGPAADGDEASLTSDKTALGGTKETTSTDSGSIRADNDLHVGDRVDITAQPGSGRYLQSLYVLQNGQMIPLQFTAPITGLNTTNPNALNEAYIQMPSGDVDVYAVFSDQQKAPNEYTATIQVNGPAGTDLQNNTATLAGPHNGASVSVTAQGGQGPAAMVVDAGGSMTVTVTLAAGYELDRVEGAPVKLLLAPQVSASDPLTYTFTMPLNSDAGVIVTVKKKAVTKYKLNLHVDHVNAPTTPAETGNETTLAYGSPTVLDSITLAGSGLKSMQVPDNETVTLTVKPQGPAATLTTAGYYVRAAYGVYQNDLISLTPVLPADYTPAAPRTAAGLEGVTDSDVQANANTATFTMPAGTTDIFVVYEYGLLPPDPWYNVVVIATDTGGATNNTGASTVEVSSKAAPGGVNAIDPKKDVKSNGVATNFYSVPQGETIHLDATRAGTGYQYDTMSLSVQVPGMTLPTLTNVDQTLHPRGEIQEFPVPAGNVGVHVNFTTAGTTGLTATLHVVRGDGVPGYPANTATLSVGQKGTPTYRSVDNAGDLVRTLTSLASNDTITTLVDPLDPDTRIERVVVTTKDKNGNAVGTVFALNPKPKEYTYIMGDMSVDVYVVLSKKKDVFLAVATPVYEDGVTFDGGKNAITDINNLSAVAGDGLKKDKFWVEVKAGHQVKVDYKAESGVYVKVTAYQASDRKAPSGNVLTPSGTAVPVAQFGIGNGASGSAYVTIPDPGCDVRIEVEFSKDPPAPQDLEFVSTGHDDQKDNTTTLDITRTTPKNTVTHTPPATPVAKADIVYTFKDYTTDTPAGDDERVRPGTKLNLGATVATGYGVDKVEIIVHTTAGDATVTYYMLPDANDKLVLMDAAKAPANAVNLQMPSGGDTTIKVYFKLKDETLRPYDPDVTKHDDYTEDHFIKAENQGDYLIVTVPILNNKEGTNPTDVTWKAQEKEDRFKFYLQKGTGASATYVALKDVITLTRPEDAPDATATDPTEYVLENIYSTKTPAKDYMGARFILTVKTDEAIDKDTAITDKAAAKALAATLREIIDNEGTALDPHKHRLYITCEETTYVDKVAQTPKESDYVDFEVPRYYALTGQLVAYAPTHITTFTLESDTADSVVFTSTLQGEGGVGLWQQEFKVKLTSDWDGKLKDQMFTLTIKKPGHVTYTHYQILLDQALKDGEGNGLYDKDTLCFSFAQPIRLIGGDVNDSGSVTTRDLDILTDLLVGNAVYTEAKEGESGWRSSIYNPRSWAYCCDMDGSGDITTKDLDILTDVSNFGFDTSAYGEPMGLNGSAPAVSLLMLEPEWLLALEAQGMTAPPWALEMVANRVEIPSWATDMLLAGQEIPAWAVDLLVNEQELPEWAQALIADGEPLPEENQDPAQKPAQALPEWAQTMLDNGEALPDWAQALLDAGEPLPEENQDPAQKPAQALPEWAQTMLDNGEALPDWAQALLDAGEPLPEENQDPAQKPAQALPEWAQTMLDNGEALPDWAQALLDAGEALPQENQDPAAPAVPVEPVTPVAPETPTETPATTPDKPSTETPATNQDAQPKPPVSTDPAGEENLTDKAPSQNEGTGLDNSEASADKVTTNTDNSEKSPAQADAQKGEALPEQTQDSSKETPIDSSEALTTKTNTLPPALESAPAPSALPGSTEEGRGSVSSSDAAEISTAGSSLTAQPDQPAVRPADDDRSAGKEEGPPAEVDSAVVS